MKWESGQARVASGVSSVELDPRDWRFADPAWQHPVWRRLAQSYVLTGRSFLDSVDELGLDEKSALRAKFALGLLVDACAPHGENPDDVEAWYRSASKNAGSWWLDWARWTAERSGDLRPRPRCLGNRAHPVLDPAPGRYVHE